MTAATWSAPSKLNSPTDLLSLVVRLWVECDPERLNPLCWWVRLSSSMRMNFHRIGTKVYFRHLIYNDPDYSCLVFLFALFLSSLQPFLPPPLLLLNILRPPSLSIPLEPLSVPRIWHDADRYSCLSVTCGRIAFALPSFHIISQHIHFDAHV